MSRLGINDRGLRIYFLLLYIILLLPISTSGEETISINYLFIFLLVNPTTYVFHKEVIFYFLFLLISLCIGIFVFSKFEIPFIIRQFISFLLYGFGVLLLFVKLRVRFEEVVNAIVIISVGYSILAIFSVVANGFSLTSIYTIKSGLREFVPDWPQRFVIILIFAEIICIANWFKNIKWQLAALVILVCVFLTFTRAAWISLILGLVVLFVLKNIFKVGEYEPNSNKKKNIWTVAMTLILVSMVIFVISTNQLIQMAFITIYDNFVGFTQTTEATGMKNDSSEGKRVFIWIKIFKILEQNPYTGTGFAGAGMIIPQTGSAHNQYMDILLRNGALGLSFYLFFWIKLFSYYFYANRVIFSAFVSMFIYGNFHETTKLTYGSFVFFIFLNFAYNKILDKETTNDN